LLVSDAAARDAWLRQNGLHNLGVISSQTAESKRLDRFLEITAELARKIGRGLRVVIAGDGTQRAEIEKLAEATRQKGVRVELLGRVTDPLALY
jgi:glycosyltransferase involved in cell wall biosynthesis